MNPWPRTLRTGFRYTETSWRPPRLSTSTATPATGFSMASAKSLSLRRSRKGGHAGGGQDARSWRRKTKLDRLLNEQLGSYLRL